jgi:hypothetical protein
MKINPQYMVRITGDGSPTLELTADADHLWAEEKMHSRHGAAAETEYIYGPAAEWTFAHVDSPRFLVAGLGLGYIEMLLVRLALARGASCEIHSFETDAFLRDGLLGWLHGEEPSPLDPVLDSVLAASAGADAASVKERLRRLHESGKWRISGALALDCIGRPGHGIFYDLYSTRLSPECWEQDFLTAFLSVAAEGVCSFATYAARGAIKKSLRAAGFELVKKKGFGQKRESTLAFRAPKEIIS